MMLIAMVVGVTLSLLSSTLSPVLTGGYSGKVGAEIFKSVISLYFQSRKTCNFTYKILFTVEPA